MHGGKRVGAGRRAISYCKKKHRRSIYVTEDLYDRVMECEFDGVSSFSQNCSKLIELGLSVMNKSNSEYYSSDNILMINEEKAKMDSKQSNEKLKFIDLFAGIGGIRMGFEDDNTICVFSSEWDKFAAKTYEANFNEKPFGDITQIDEKEIPDHDVLLAGFPCQPFSNIGKREGFSHETQGTLFFDIIRILKEKKPKMFLLENVKGLLTSDKGRTYQVIMESLKELGYSVFDQVLDAQNFGLPQRRERVVIVGFHPNLKVDEFTFPMGDPTVRVPVNSILEQKDTGYTISKHLQDNYLFKKDDGKPQIVDFNSTIQVNTLVASYHKIQRLTGTFVRDGETGIRLFTELELKRLMGFPEDFIVPVSRTQMYRQFGNSVAVPMIEAVAKEMKNTLIRANYPNERVEENLVYS